MLLYRGVAGSTIPFKSTIQKCIPTQILQNTVADLMIEQNLNIL